MMKSGGKKMGAKAKPKTTGNGKGTMNKPSAKKPKGYK